MKNSKFFSINLLDLAKGFVVAGITAGITAMVDGLQNGWDLDWANIGRISLIAGSAYLLKNLFSGEKPAKDIDVREN